MNKKVEILDCTLRDGGYVNDWRFGDENAKEIVSLVFSAGVDYAELAFIRNSDYEKGKLEFSEMKQVTDIFRPFSHKLAIMVEIGYGYPIEKFPIRSDLTVDLVRIVVWKRMLKESFEYAKQLLEKGYEVAIQATRTEQYNTEEFTEFIHLFSELNLKAIYIVDTFGLLTKDSLLHYAQIADDNLGEGIRLGYHAHNNMQQAFSNMVAFVEHDWKHDLMVDASVMGMGRGAGNLCLELLGKYMNEHGENMNLEPMYEVAETYLKPFYEKTPWGYSMPYMLSAMNGRNPSYVKYMQDKGLTIPQMAEVYAAMKEQGVGITYDIEMCNKLIEKIKR